MSNDNRLGFRVTDGRALMAAMALMITGTIVAMMVHHYVASPAPDNAITRSRLWWEIVLNLQLLSVGMIWFCYSDRIGDASGRVKGLQILLCAFAIVSVLMPSILGAISAANNWFEIRPNPSTFTSFFAFGVGFWLVTLVVQIILLRLRNKYSKRDPIRRGIRFYTPAIILGVILLIDAPGGGTRWLVMTPVLLYLQGALPYLMKAFRQKHLPENKFQG